MSIQFIAQTFADNVIEGVALEITDAPNGDQRPYVKRAEFPGSDLVLGVARANSVSRHASLDDEYTVTCVVGGRTRAWLTTLNGNTQAHPSNLLRTEAGGSLGLIHGTAGGTGIAILLETVAAGELPRFVEVLVLPPARVNVNVG